jgi:hypothetical protein
VRPRFPQLEYNLLKEILLVFPLIAVQPANLVEDRLVAFNDAQKFVFHSCNIPGSRSSWPFPRPSLRFTVSLEHKLQSPAGILQTTHIFRTLGQSLRTE